MLKTPDSRLLLCTFACLREFEIRYVLIFSLNSHFAETAGEVCRAAVIGHPCSIISADISEIVDRKYSCLRFFYTALASFRTINRDCSCTTLAYATAVILEIKNDGVLSRLQ